MRNINLSENEVRVLSELAKVSKMDNWFQIKEDGTTYDLESAKHNQPKNNVRMIRQLVEGTTRYDLECLEYGDIDTLLGIALKLN